VIIKVGEDTRYEIHLYPKWLNPKYVWKVEHLNLLMNSRCEIRKINS
jgi:hypothetical protein